MALRNPCFKDQNWSHLREPVEREREEQRREEEEEEEGVIKQAKKVWMLGFWYGNYFEYGSNLVYELYYESHGFCMGF